MTGDRREPMRGAVPSKVHVEGATGRATAAPQRPKWNRQQQCQAQIARPAAVPVAATPTLQSVTLTSQEMSVQQKTEVVQTFLYATVSQILHIRDLMPEHCFKTMHYTEINQHCSYHDFTHGDQDRVQAGHNLSILKRGVDSRADDIIHRLETGVFDAIDRGYLGELQFSIFEDPEKPLQALEVYSFKFEYSEPTTLTGRAAHVNLELVPKAGGKKITLENARDALNNVVRSMVRIHNTTRILPGGCCAKLVLLWNNCRPRGYQPAGFKPSADDMSVSLPVNGFETTTEPCGKVDVGNKAVRLQVCFIADDGDDIPPGLQYGRPVPRSSLFQNTHDLSSSGRSILPHENKTNNLGLNNIASETENRLPPTAGQANAPGRSNRTKDGAEREVLTKMLQLQPPNHSDDTQKLAALHPTQARIQFSETTMRRMDRDRNGLLPLREEVISRTAPLPGDRVLCQCGVDTVDEDAMFCCAFCDSWQHHVCYGYHKASDRLPQLQACYNCLFGKANVGELCELITARRIIRALQGQSFDTQTDLGAVTGYRKQDVATALGKLEEQQIVTISRKAPRISLNSLPDAKSRIAAQYFNPATGIVQFLATNDPITVNRPQILGKRNLPDSFDDRTPMKPTPGTSGFWLFNKEIEDSPSCRA